MIKTSADLSKAEKEIEDQKVKWNYPLEKKFMIFGNSPSRFGDQVHLGTVVGYTERHGKIWPLFRGEDGTNFYSFGVHVAFDPIKYEMFNKMTWDERWNAVAHNCAALTKQQARNLEAGRPAWDNGDGTETT